MLQHKQYSIQDIASIVGYEEATNFIRAFKRPLEKHQANIESVA